MRYGSVVQQGERGKEKRREEGRGRERKVVGRQRKAEEGKGESESYRGV